MKHIVISTMIALFAAISARADYHYVSHSGSDEYPYTNWETAADSVHDAVAAAEPGDTVYIASGEYEGATVVNPADSPIAIIGTGMDSTYLFTPLEQDLFNVGGAIYLQGMRFSTPYTAVGTFVAGADIMAEECWFSGTGYGITSVASNVIVRNCIFENLDRMGIAEPFSTNLSLEVTNCLFRNIFAEPINVSSRHAVIRNNIVLNTGNQPPFFLPYGDYQFITNNVIYNTVIGGIFSELLDSTSRIDNNTLDYLSRLSYDYSVSVHSPDFDWAMRNNSLTNSGAAIGWASDQVLSVQYTNTWHNIVDFVVRPGYNGSIDTAYGVIHVDPMFVDSTNFHLQAFSPLIDAGDPAILDVDNSRSDIGTYGGPGGSSYFYQDLPPRIPDSLAFRVWNDTIYLAWRANYEADFFAYQLHRDTVLGFTPSPLNLVDEPESSFYVDSDVVLGQTYYYKIVSLDNQGNLSEYSAEIAVVVTAIWQGDGAEMPRMTVIESNYPNPFNSTTNIVYSVANLGPVPAEITIEIYDIMGRKVRTLVNERKEVGIYKVVWDGKGDANEDMPSGTYFARISQWGIGFMNKPKKVVLLK
jgi:hypothetical protein